MALNDIEIARVNRALSGYIQRKRPRPEIRDQVDVGYRIENQSVLVFEIRPLWRHPGEKIEEFGAKATFVRSQNVWKIYWKRADLKWHGYEPNIEVDTIDAFVEVLEKDEFCCFWG